jgi:hypothetical protein
MQAHPDCASQGSPFDHYNYLPRLYGELTSGFVILPQKFPDNQQLIRLIKPVLR